MISYEHIESSLGALSGVVFWRAVVNSDTIKSPETLTGVAVGVLQRYDISFDTSRGVSQSAPLYGAMMWRKRGNDAGTGQ